VNYDPLSVRNTTNTTRNIRLPAFPTSFAPVTRGRPLGTKPPSRPVSEGSSRGSTTFALLLAVNVKVVLSLPVDDVSRRPLGELELPGLLTLTDVCYNTQHIHTSVVYKY